jgi:tetratricopeptide (TPR) repeat protein
MKTPGLHGKKYILSVAILFLLAPSLHAGETSIGALFLDEGVSPRATAMGEAFTAVTDDVNTVYWNPAGLTGALNAELLLAHTEFLQNFRDEYLAFTLPVTTSDVLGMNAFFSYSGAFDKTSLANEDLGSFQTYDSFVSVAWGHAWDKTLSLGLTLKGIYQVIDVYSAWSAAADLGIVIRNPVPDVNLALTLRNLGKPVQFIDQAYLLPMSGDLGASWHLLGRDLLLTADIVKPLEQELLFKAGVEYTFEGMLSLRAGYRYNQNGNTLGWQSGLTAGAGLVIADYTLDYSFSPYAELGNVHRIALTFPFGKNIHAEEQIVARLEKQIREKQESIVKGYWQTGEGYFQKNDWVNALVYYGKVQALNPGYPGLKNRLDAANNKIKSQNVAKHFQKGMDAFKKKEYILAILEWNKVLEIKPNDPEADRWILSANLKINQEESSAKSSSKTSSDIHLHLTRGLEALRQGEYRKAIENWKAALAEEPENAQVKNYLQKTKIKMQEEIEELLDQAEEDWQSGDWPAAVKNWRQVIKIDPENAQAGQALTSHLDKIKSAANDLYLKGVEHYVKNQLLEAIVNWKEVLILDPDNLKAAKHLSYAQEKLKEIEAF